MSGADGRRCAGWRRGMSAGVLVSALGLGAVAGALPSVAAPTPPVRAVAAAGLPAVPMDFEADEGNGNIVFSFTAAPAGTGPVVTGYEISIDNAVTWKAVETIEAPSNRPDPTKRTGSVDGTRDDVVYRVALRAVFDGGVGPATAVVSTAPQSLNVRRLSGPDRVATAVTVSQDVFPAAGSAPAAVITTSATYADALAGAALAAKVDGPLLLTSPTALEPTVATEIRRAVKAGGTVYVLGDAGAVSADVEKTLMPAFTVTRLAGADRYATARAVADKMRALGAKGPAYLATGANYPDGLSVSALAARTDGLVILSEDRTLDAGTRAWITKDDPTGSRTVPVGGPAAAAAASPAAGGAMLSAPITARAIIGVDRYDTSARVAQAYGPFPASAANAPRRTIGLATGTNWPDALVGAAAMGTLAGPLLLTDGGAANLPRPTIVAIATLVQDTKDVDGLLFGGADVLNEDLVAQFRGTLPYPFP